MSLFQTRIARRLNIATVILPDGHVMISRDDGLSFVLPPVGALVWEFADGTLSLDQMVDHIANYIPRQKGAIREEVTELCHALLTDGFLEDGRSDVPAS